ncbi:hypothetical protein B296_00056414, partial [Ensete ventricosum]
LPPLQQGPPAWEGGGRFRGLSKSIPGESASRRSAEMASPASTSPCFSLAAASVSLLLSCLQEKCHFDEAAGNRGGGIVTLRRGKVCEKSSPCVLR